MDTELSQIADLLEALTDPEGQPLPAAAQRSAFEAWENRHHPEPFPVKGPALDIGGCTLDLPGKGSWRAYLNWNARQARPELIVENRETRYPCPIRITGEGPQLESGPPEPVSPPPEMDGEAVEVVYDVIQLILDQNPRAEILKLKKRAFTAVLEELAEVYPAALLKRMRRMSAAALKALIRQAAEDMALDELTAQLSLPLNSTYAYSAGAASPEHVDSGADEAESMPARTPWTIAREAALLTTLARITLDVQRGFALPLSGGSVVDAVGASRTILRLSGVGAVPVYEASRMHIVACDDMDGGAVGSGVIRLMDDDTLFVELFWDAAGETGNPEQNLERFCLKPLQPPQQRMLFQMRALSHQLREAPGLVRGALRTILGLEGGGALRMDGVPGGGQADGRMDRSQQNALAAAVHPDNPVVAVQGPPGTGKTWVLIQVIRRLCEQGLRLLITAPSNIAVDNICRAVADLPLLRFGHGAKVDPAVQESCWAGSSENVDAFIRKYAPGRTGSIYAATHVRAIFEEIINRDLKGRGLYDVVIFDEAGMSRMDEFLLCARMGKRVIVFGDHRQLPPFPLADAVLEQLAAVHPHLSSLDRQILHQSALEWLATRRGAPVMLLDRAYRCQNPRLMRFSSTLFYRARVRTSETAAYYRLPFYERQKAYPPGTLRFYCTSFLPEAIRRETVVLDEERVGIENGCEADICRYVLLEALQRYPAWEITIITPYRRQVSRIRERLSYSSIRDDLPRPMDGDEWERFLAYRIATVDGFQGGESDLVILSYVRSSADGGIGFVDNPNRINVAHTRCRREIVIIGDLECLKARARSDIFARMERAFNRDGEIIDLDEELYAAMREAAGA